MLQKNQVARLLSIVGIALGILPLSSYGQASVCIDTIRVNDLKKTVQYVVELRDRVPVTEHTYLKPFRKVFSWYHVKLCKPIGTESLSNAYVSQIVLESHPDHVSVGLHLTRAYRVHSSYWSADATQGIRYVIDIDKHAYKSTWDKPVTFDREKALASLNAHLAPSVHHFIEKHLGSTTPSTTAPVALNMQKIHMPTTAAKSEEDVQVPVVANSNSDDKAKRYSSKVIVVIDPGHGGKDPGATGPSGTHEKKVVLAIAKRLQSAINSNPGFKAVLTRGDDRYLSLRYRLALAREYHGDLFVAIHADAYINASASGASVFALSSRGATSEAARWLAQRENQSELMGGVDLADKDPTLRSVLIDLSQTATISASLQMGSGIISHLRSVVPMHVKHVEQAAFVVLKSPDIPSLLIETGFLSNPTEEQQLTMASHQERLADAIAQGIVQYFTSNPPAGSWLYQQTHSQPNS